MAEETDPRGPDLLEELVTSDGDSEGSESEFGEAEREVAAAGRDYNLRSRQIGAGAATSPVRRRKDASAPGAGVVADRYHVGGRDERVWCGALRMNTESEDSVAEAYDELPRPRSVRPGGTRELSHRASPLYESMSRGELEAQSARLISQLRRSMQERAKRPPPPTNELVIRRDFSRPSDAGRSEKSRREPRASNLLGQAPVKPGRGLFSDNRIIEY